jgi:hypothetical protein
MDSIKLLLSGYWGRQGWQKPSFTIEQTRCLSEAGLIRPSQTLDHDAALDWALSVRDRIDASLVSSGFLFSLTSRDLRYRSALGSFAHLQHMPRHKHRRAEGFFTDICAICGFDDTHGRAVDFGVLNFERHKWGGIRHDQLVYMAFDLEQFLALPPPPDPSQESKGILLSILDAASSSKSFTALKKALGAVVKSNDSERAQLCQILGYAGILQPSDCPAFDDAYIPWANRGDGKPRSDMNYPLGWWPGMSYRQAGVNYWFPGLLKKGS